MSNEAKKIPSEEEFVAGPLPIKPPKRTWRDKVFNIFLMGLIVSLILTVSSISSEQIWPTLLFTAMFVGNFSFYLLSSGLIDNTMLKTKMEESAEKFDKVLEGTSELIGKIIGYGILVAIGIGIIWGAIALIGSLSVPTLLIIIIVILLLK